MGKRLLALFAVAAALRLALLAATGTHFSSDTAAYLAACGRVADDPSALLTDLVGWEYAGFLVPFCAATVGGNQPGFWPVAQALVSAVVPVLLVSMGAHLGSPRGGWSAGVAYAALPEALLWDVWVLSDAWFTAVLTAALWALTTPRGRRFAPVLVAWMALSRPFGLPVAAALLVAHAATGALPALRLRRVAAAAAALALPVVQQALSFRSSWTQTYFPALWKDGTVVFDDDTLRFPSDATGATPLEFLLQDPLHVPALAVAKVAVFFLPVWPRLSPLHNLVDLLTLTPVLFLGLYGVVRAARARVPLALAGAAVVVAVTGVVALTFIDYDWRYRMPLLPVLTLFAAMVVFPGPTQAWPHPGGWASRPLRRLGVPAEHAATLQRLRASTPWDELEETAIPSYVHPDPVLRWLFHRRLEVAAGLVGDSPGRVVDVGCGGGLFSEALRVAGHDVVSLDLDARFAHAVGVPVLLRGDALRLPLVDASADTVVALDVAEHFDALAPFVAEVRRVLRPGGRLVLSGPSESRLYRLGRRVAGYEGHYHERGVRDILDAFRDAGWTVGRERVLPPAVGLFRLAVLHPPEAA